MSEKIAADSATLNAECEAFCVYLVGQEASEYIRQRYCEAHHRTDLVRQNHFNLFDRFIIHFGRRGILCTRLADIYTRWFYRQSSLRSKLLLLMAILECSKSTYSLFESSQPRSKARICFEFMLKGIRWILCLIVSFIFFSVSYPIVKFIDKVANITRAKCRWIRS